MTRKCRTVTIEIHGGRASAEDEGYVGDECEKMIELFGHLFPAIIFSYTDSHDKKRPSPHHQYSTQNEKNNQTN